MQNQQGQMNTSAQRSDQMQPMQDHGGHEMFDVHETLTTAINVLDQYMIFRPYVQDQELLGILDQQYDYITTQYNRMVEAFSTGQKPSVDIQPYEIPTMGDITYGLQPSPPQKPTNNLGEVNEQGISSHMLGLLKSTSSMFAMSAAEVTNSVLRRVIADSIPDFIEMSYELFLYQNKHGYYQVPQLQQTDMDKMTHGYEPSQANIKQSNPGQVH
ncbi:spore coat protein [Natribacillus halophilus]|uniref:Spore coat protein CotF n=1 Tax=Natribacillus halophilus TaxID=549003 RepID=A0A1G8R1R9_9BACI|nr:spore coat protein [Natribacillus halophilus]SDJ10929.1 Spore coat protein CotF [Natribacillus halophilus]